MNEPLKILMIEDNDADAEIIRRLLLKENRLCTFSTVMTKEDYLTALEEFHPQVILSDNSMPQFSAREALSLAQQRQLHVPFIMVTGTVSEEFAVEIIRSGADDYILKDRLNRLPSAINMALHQRKIEKEIEDYKYALDQSSIVSITDKHGIIKNVNANFCAISKYSMQELIDKDYSLLKSGHHLQDYFLQLWSTIISGNIWKGELCNKAKDGTLFWVDTTIVPFLDEAGAPLQYIAIQSDISQKKALEAEILFQKVQAQKKITRAMLKAEESQRHYIGLELHDNINQILAAANMHLNTATKQDSRLKELVQFPKHLINTCIEEIRRLCRDLVAPDKNINLKALIETLLLNLDDVSSLETELYFDLPEDFAHDDIKINIYRIVQEQVNNVIKHANARQLIITIQQNETYVEVIIEDNGKGFNPSGKYAGIGLANIINRVESFNGEVTFKSSPGNGCILSAHIPYFENQDQE